MHYSEGKLRAYIDDELGANEERDVSTHLQACEECQEKYNTLSRNALQVEKHLAVISSDFKKDAKNIISARKKLDEIVLQTQGRKQDNFILIIRKLFSEHNRSRLTIGLAFLLTGVLLAFPQVRAAAVELLAIFRVQQIDVVEFNPAKLPKEFNQKFATLEQFLSENISVISAGDPRELSGEEEASKLANLKVRLPADLTGEEMITYHPGVTVQFYADVQRMTSFLKELGEINIEIPETLVGKTIELEIGESITLVYGTCLLGDELIIKIPVKQRTCVSFTQMPSPKVSAPPGLDIELYGISILQILGLSTEEARDFSKEISWSTTLVIPVPQGANYKKLEIDDVPGVLFEGAGDPGQQYTLIWVKEDILYGLSGIGNLSDAFDFIRTLN